MLEGLIWKGHFWLRPNKHTYVHRPNKSTLCRDKLSRAQVYMHNVFCVYDFNRPFHFRANKCKSRNKSPFRLRPYEDGRGKSSGRRGFSPIFTGNCVKLVREKRKWLLGAVPMKLSTCFLFPRRSLFYAKGWKWK